MTRGLAIKRGKQNHQSSQYRFFQGLLKWFESEKEHGHGYTKDYNARVGRVAAELAGLIQYLNGQEFIMSGELLIEEASHTEPGFWIRYNTTAQAQNLPGIKP
ncbi:MAG: hypothetical protein KKG59_01025 [Nanoarchaeota archaeon]|nr:hypothetical protein [Nanoarchaeota archaeon]